MQHKHLRTAYSLASHSQPYRGEKPDYMEHSQVPVNRDVVTEVDCILKYIYL